MPKKMKQTPRKVVLRLPDLDHAKSAVLSSLSSPQSSRNYKFAMEHGGTSAEPQLRPEDRCSVDDSRSNVAGEIGAQDHTVN
jgi:hypothetical protein